MSTIRLYMILFRPWNASKSFCGPHVAGRPYVGHACCKLFGVSSNSTAYDWTRFVTPKMCLGHTASRYANEFAVLCEANVPLTVQVTNRVLF